MTALDEVAWLLNLRGTDVAFNPVFISYSIITTDGCTLYIDERKLTAATREHLAAAGVAVRGYGQMLHDVRELAAHGTRIMADPSKASRDTSTRWVCTCTCTHRELSIGSGSTARFLWLKCPGCSAGLIGGRPSCSISSRVLQVSYVLCEAAMESFENSRGGRKGGKKRKSLEGADEQQPGFKRESILVEASRLARGLGKKREQAESGRGVGSISSAHAHQGGPRARGPSPREREEKAETPRPRETPLPRAPRRKSANLSHRAERQRCALWMQVPSPVMSAKAVKTDAELRGMREAHLRDAVALAEFFHWLEGAVTAGQKLTEVDIGEILLTYRKKQEGFKEPSFPTIAGSGPNGAVIHYRAHPGPNNRAVTKDQVGAKGCWDGRRCKASPGATGGLSRRAVHAIAIPCCVSVPSSRCCWWTRGGSTTAAPRTSLVPCTLVSPASTRGGASPRCSRDTSHWTGGRPLGGCTSARWSPPRVTSTRSPCSSLRYRVVFPEGTPGAAIDMLARSALWRMGLNYRHGTGHGVGAALNVHEGPMSISPRMHITHPLTAGMVVSNEPGYYEDGKFGIRIENLVAIREADTPFRFGGMSFFGFERLTLHPIQARDLVPPIGSLSGPEVGPLPFLTADVADVAQRHDGRGGRLGQRLPCPGLGGRLATAVGRGQGVAPGQDPADLQAPVDAIGVSFPHLPTG